MKKYIDERKRQQAVQTRQLEALRKSHQEQFDKLNQEMDRVSSCQSFSFGRPFVKRFALCYRTIVCLSCPVCNVDVLSPNGSMDQDATLCGGRPRPRPHCARWGPRSPSPKGGRR